MKSSASTTRMSATFGIPDAVKAAARPTLQIAADVVIE
jgi:hypothetical protein